MREIKFRVRNKGSIYGYEMLLSNRWQWSGEKIAPEDPSDWAVGVFKGDDLQREQFTGLKDKNGKEIYDGDIAEYIGHKSRVISWTPDDNHYAGWYAVKEGSMPLPVGEGNENNTIEVIGNIWENPSLTETQGQSTKEGASS